MTKYLFLLALALSIGAANRISAQANPEFETQRILNSLEQAFQWQTGAVTIGDHLAEFNVPTGWRFLPFE